MFWNKQRRETDKLILADDVAAGAAADDPSVINVKVGSRDQIFSAYSYSGDKLNTEFSDYIMEKAKDVPITDPIKIKIHADEELDADEIGQTMKSHYRAAYKDAKKAVKRISLISVIMTVFGLIALTALILINYFTDNLYITSVVEIAAWVFIWEAVDYFFLQRPVEKAKCILIQRIYLSEIEVCK